MSMNGVQVAAEFAEVWCNQNPKWKRFCDIENTDALMLSWDELPKAFRKQFDKYHEPERFWLEFGQRPYRHRYGFIGQDNNFYADVTDVPTLISIMMVFEVGGRKGTFFQGGMHARSGIIGNSKSTANAE